MAVFLNGKLLPKDEILQMSNSVYKITTDKNTRYNIDVKGMSPRISALVPYYKREYWEEELPKYESFKDVQCRIKVVPTYNELGRQILQATFNPVYFDPSLLDEPDLWINFVKRGKTHTYPDNTDMQYTIKFFKDDLTDEQVNVLAIMQLRLRHDKKHIMDDPNALLIATIPSELHETNDDYILNSFQVSNMVRQAHFRSKSNVDSIIGTLQPDLKDTKLGLPIYMEVTSNKMEELTTIGLFEWTVTTEKNNKGVCRWKKHIDIEPDNKKQLLRIGDD
jgi:hypothetical protein